jgi:hypothetical protein
MDEPLLVTVGPGPEIESMIDATPPSTTAPRSIANMEIDIDDTGLSFKSKEGESIQYTRGFFVGYAIDFLEAQRIDSMCIRIFPSNGWPPVRRDRVSVRDNTLLVNVAGLIVPQQAELRLDLICSSRPIS